jgi:hypothetical protein
MLVFSGTFRVAVVGFLLGFFLCATSVAAQDSDSKPGGSSPRWYNPSRYNPLKLIKRSAKSANDQLASDDRLEENLTKQLRMLKILPADRGLQEACSNFRDLAVCVAVLRLTHNHQIQFTCLKWDVTGIKPKPVADSCAGPAGGKAMPLDKAVDLLKPDIDARTESKNALKRAHDDITDASGS